jgi:hypothetical protein
MDQFAPDHGEGSPGLRHHGRLLVRLNDKPRDGVQSMLDALNATTGWDVTLDELIDAGTGRLFCRASSAPSAAGSPNMTGKMSARDS